MPDTLRICLITTLILGIASTAPAQEKKDDKKSPMTPAERQALLKTFNGEFVAITPGKGKFPATFVMGTKGGDASERPPRTVKISGAFSMAKYEVPQNHVSYTHLTLPTICSV